PSIWWPRRGAVVAGSFLLVCDWGSRFTASVLRRTRYGFDVLSTVDAAEGGGSGLDQAVAGHLTALSRVAHPAGAAGWRVVVGGPVGAGGAVPGARGDDGGAALL